MCITSLIDKKCCREYDLNETVGANAQFQNYKTYSWQTCLSQHSVQIKGVGKHVIFSYSIQVTGFLNFVAIFIYYKSYTLFSVLFVW
jgi:hypothetical protein